LVDIVIRVLGGTNRGRKLRSPKGMLFRPTTGRVKEFIFSFIGDWIEGISVLDLFAGSGALGIEALSRGAKEVVFIEHSHRQIDLVRHNLKLCELNEQAIWICGDVFNKIKKLGQQHYRSQIVDAVDKNFLLNSNGLLMVEHVFNDPDSKKYELNLIKQRQFGHCMISVYQ
jgi:16S rRNA (guanine966-N2)-methyltransferase